MTDDKVKELVQKFTGELVATIREQVFQTVGESFGGSVTPKRTAKVQPTEVLAYADKHGNHKASEKFSVPVKTIGGWKSRRTVNRRSKKRKEDV